MALTPCTCSMLLLSIIHLVLIAAKDILLCKICEDEGFLLIEPRNLTMHVDAFVESKWKSINVKTLTKLSKKCKQRLLPNQYICGFVFFDTLNRSYSNVLTTLDWNKYESSIIFFDEEYGYKLFEEFLHRINIHN